MKREETLFAEAAKLPISERESFLRKNCHGDHALQERLDQLLSAHECEDVFLDIAETQSSEIQGIVEGDEVDSYRLLQKLGEGGFGVVYMAQQQQPVERKVAIKVIKPGMDSRAVIARFEGERQALAMMDHPNIARVFDGGAIDNGQRPYFVMELVQGVSITEFCDANSLSTRERLELFTSVCHAVHHAHQKGIIHRDIKPNNVMVTLHDGVPVVKVIDFGVAKALHQRLTEKTLFTRYGMMVGTPQYMSPEQAEMTGLDVDIRSDIYSLSVLLYELMTGTTPLDSQELHRVGLQKLQRMICEDEPLLPSLQFSTAGENLTSLAKLRGVSPERLSREVKGDLDWIIMKGLEKDRTRRYESAKGLAADIHRALNHQPVAAGPPSWLYRTKKFVRRHRTGVILVAASMAVVILTLVGWFNHRQHLSAAIEKDETRLTNAINDGNSALVAAAESPNSAELWLTAQLASIEIDELIEESSAKEATLSHARSFLERFEIASQDRQFSLSMEELLVKYSTKSTIESWQKMEAGFRQILKKRGIDLDCMSPDDVAVRLKDDHAPIKLTDALELWLAIRIRLDDSGIQAITSKEIQEWLDAMNRADSNALRTAIRAAIFQEVKPEKSLLDEAVSAGDLSEMCARKLSWLAQAYQQVGDSKRSVEVLDDALVLHSNDLMLNFEHAIRLMEQARSDEAIRYLMRCTSIRPGIPGVWKKLAEALEQNGELLQAKKTIRIAIDLEPNDYGAHLQLSKWLLQDNQAVEAITAAERALSLNEVLYPAWRVIGRANMVLEKYPQALVAFEEFLDCAKGSERVSVEEWIVDCKDQIKSSR